MIRLPCYFTGFSSKADGSFGLRFATQELSVEDVMELKKDLNEFGMLVFTKEYEKEEKENKN